MAVITSDHGVMRYLSIKWPQSPRVCAPFSNGDNKISWNEIHKIVPNLAPRRVSRHMSSQRDDMQVD